MYLSSYLSIYLSVIYRDLISEGLVTTVFAALLTKSLFKDTTELKEAHPGENNQRTGVIV